MLGTTTKTRYSFFPSLNRCVNTYIHLLDFDTQTLLGPARLNKTINILTTRANLTGLIRIL